MPVMEGSTLVRSLARTSLFMPVAIFVSGFRDIDLKEMYSLGAEAFFAKPVRRDELIGVLERCISERSTLWSDARVTTPRQSIALEGGCVDIGPDASFLSGTWRLCSPGTEAPESGQDHSLLTSVARRTTAKSLERESCDGTPASTGRRGLNLPDLTRAAAPGSSSLLPELAHAASYQTVPKTMVELQILYQQAELGSRYLKGTFRCHWRSCDARICLLILRD